MTHSGLSSHVCASLPTPAPLSVLCGATAGAAKDGGRGNASLCCCTAANSVASEGTCSSWSNLVLGVDLAARGARALEGPHALGLVYNIHIVPVRNGHIWDRQL
jgi:hypothetical protein